MKEIENPTSYTIDLRQVLRGIYDKRKVYIKWLPIVFVLACLVILPEPRYYRSEVMLAPEMGADETRGGGLSSLASSFGLNIGGSGADAIYPSLYPDLFSSPQFIVDLLGTEVHYDDDDLGHIDTDYYTYITKYQKKNWLTWPFRKAKRLVMTLVNPDDPADSLAGSATRLNAFKLSKHDYELLEKVPRLISCTVDKKYDVTTITVEAQDPLVSAQMADSVRLRLQAFIIEYRTAKARIDVEYYTQLTAEAKTEYEVAVDTFTRFADAHLKAFRQSYIVEQDALQNDMLQKQNTYSTMMAQLTAAKAKVQECTPAFVTLKTATVPVKPAGPKRMIFVAAMLFLAFVGITLYQLRDLLFPFKQNE